MQKWFFNRNTQWQEKDHAAIFNCTRYFVPHIGNRLALAIAIAIRSTTRGYSYRTRKFQFSFSIDDWLVNLDLSVIDRMVDAEMKFF